MGFVDTFKNWIGVGPVEPEEPEEQQPEAVPQPEPVKAAPQPVLRMPREEKRGGRNTMTEQDHAQVVLVRPTSFDDATPVADHLAQKHTVVLNLEDADRDTTRRLVDFLSGAAYAHGGTLRRVAKQTFLITPAGTETLGELIDDPDAGSSY